MSADEDGAGGESWRDDPLSVFLVVAAILLAAMYGLETWRISVAEEGAERAASLDAAALKAANCTSAAAGLRGERLVFDCRAPASDAADHLAGSLGVGALDAFEEVLIRGEDAFFLCPVDPSGWPGSCNEKPRPVKPVEDEEE